MEGTGITSVKRVGQFRQISVRKGFRINATFHQIVLAFRTLLPLYKQKNLSVEYIYIYIYI